MTETHTRKLLCRECAWVGPKAEILTAPSPFRAGDEIVGCPRCFGVECFAPGCDAEGCRNAAIGGTPTDNGYLMLCSVHFQGYIG